MKLGITGGTFNPIHLSHLIIAEEMRCEYNIDEILFIPAGDPPHKNEDEIIGAKHRLEMVELAIQGNKYFTVSDMEIKRQGKTYTIDTLRDLMERYGEDTKIYFICGTDTIHSLLTWKSTKEVFKLCTFLAAKRGDEDIIALVKHIKYLQDEHGAKIHLANTNITDISSTDIRGKVKNNNSIKYLVTNKVHDYIMKYNLYK